jgi:hypothetical protein
LAATVSIPAYATSFSYTYLGGEVGRVSLDEEIYFDGEIYKGLAYLNISGGYQFSDNFALSFTNAAATNNGRTTELSEYAFVVAGHFPFAVSPAMDIVPFVGYAWLEAEACQFNICSIADDSDLTYGINLRTWVIPGQFELGIGYADSNLEDLKSVVTLSGAIWFEYYHRVSFNHSVTDLDRTTTLGYSFNW